MTNEELEHGSFEIENRIRNLMWTISGDYDLDTKPDVTSFYKSKSSRELFPGFLTRMLLHSIF